MFPFSFQEYGRYYDETGDKEKLFNEYFIEGGLAGSYTGIRYAVSGSRNMVCIELPRRGYDVYVGKLYQKEMRNSIRFTRQTSKS